MFERTRRAGAGPRLPARPSHRPGPVRRGHGAWHGRRRHGRSCPRRDRDAQEHGHRHYCHDGDRRRGSLSILERAHRHLQPARGTAGLLRGDRRADLGHRQCAAARRPDDEGRRHRRNGPGHRRGAAARERIERSRPGHRPRADRQSAAQRPRLRRPRAAQPGRPQVVDLRVPRRLVQRQRPAQLAQQLHSRRRRQQLLRHQQPGLLEPGRAGVAGRGAGVQGPDQQLQRRVRARRRRCHQRHVPQRHQPVARLGLGVQPQHRSQRHRLLQAVVGRQADAQAQPVRRRRRRPDRQGQGVLLRQLRRLPPGAADGDVRQHPDDGAAAGRDG